MQLRKQARKRASQARKDSGHTLCKFMINNRCKWNKCPIVRRNTNQKDRYEA